MKLNIRSVFLSICFTAIVLISVSNVKAVPHPNSIKWKANPKAFVTSLYVGVLGRKPENQSVVTAWAKRINKKPNSRMIVFNEFLNSREYRSKGWRKQKKEWYVFVRETRRRSGGFVKTWSIKKSPNTDAGMRRMQGPFIWGIAKARIGYLNAYSNYRN